MGDYTWHRLIVVGQLTELITIPCLRCTGSGQMGVTNVQPMFGEGSELAVALATCVDCDGKGYEGEPETVAETIEGFGTLGQEYEGPGPLHRLELVGETGWGTLEELGAEIDKLMEAHDDLKLAYMGWSDADGQYLGDIRIHVPGFPIFTSECDSEGTVIVRKNEILGAFQESMDFDGVKAWIEQLYGTPQHDEFDKLECDACGKVGATDPHDYQPAG